MSKQYTPKPGDFSQVSYTTATKSDEGMMFEVDKPIIKYEREKWVVVAGQAMPYKRFLEQFNVKEFKKL